MKTPIFTFQVVLLSIIPLFYEKNNSTFIFLKKLGLNSYISAVPLQELAKKKETGRYPIEQRIKEVL